MTALNTAGRCSGCHGVVSNATRKRHTIERLTAIHAESCPAVKRVRPAGG